MGFGKALVCIFGLIASASAFGQSLSCFPDSTSLQSVEQLSAARPLAIIRPLLTPHNGGNLITKVQWRAISDASDPTRLEMKILFDPDFHGVSLPYNLYAVMAVIDGEVVGWWDFTHSCQGPGVGFFPGQEIRLPAVKLIGDKPQKLQIMVWGRI